MSATSPLTIKLQDNQILIYYESDHTKPLQVREVCRPSIQPIVKWAGGKQWLAIAAKIFAPPIWKGEYYEPFAGAAAFFFALQPGLATLSDCNQELIETYRAICSDASRVIHLLGSYPYDKNFYYQIRKKIPNTSYSRAARFLYLNRTCWNGLYRVNSKGIFNTPFGRFRNPTICDSERILTAANLLSKAKLYVADFADVALRAKSGDFVYLDPPYITGHHNNGFLKYNKHLFSWSDQERLAELAAHLTKSGVYVLLSNADHSQVVGLYKGFYYYKIVRRSLIGGKVTARGVITEALMSNYPLLGCKSGVIT